MWEFRHNLIIEKFADYEDLTLSGVTFIKEEIGALEIRFENFNEIKFENCHFNKTIFNNVFFSKIKFINCELNNVIFTECNFNYVNFENSKLTDTSFTASKLENIYILETLIQYSKFSTSEIGNSKYDDVKLTENIHYKNKYNNIEFYKCEFNRNKFR